MLVVNCGLGSGPGGEGGGGALHRSTRVSRQTRILATPTFLDDLSMLIQQPLDLAAPHVGQPHLRHKGLGPVELFSQGHLSLHCH